jgi:CelD/BcsL family acetyltransferase involved in cellulose biosynthesis
VTVADPNLAVERALGAEAERVVEQALADGAVDGTSPFHTSVWLAATLRHLVVPAALVVYAVEGDGRCQAVLPLLADGAGLRPPAGPLADIQGPVCAPEARTATVLAVMAAVAADASLSGGADLLALPVDAADALLGSCPDAVGVDELTMSIDCSGDWATYLGARDARRRRRIVRDSERLLDEPGARVVDAGVDEDALALLPMLVALHLARFGDTSGQFAGARHPFFEDVVGAFAEVDGVRLRVLLLDGRPAAAILCWVADGEWWYYQSGWDPAFAGRSPGRALFADTVRQAFVDPAVDHFHLLRGDETYKQWWATSPSFRVVDVSVPPCR